jgi:tetratricopeptide (TPR) repeat protein
MMTWLRRRAIANMESLGALSIRRSARLSMGQQPQQAAKTAARAVRAYRELVAAGEQRHAPNLAAALAHLGTTLAMVERWEPAAAATREATEVYRGLAATDPHQYDGVLGECLNSLGNQLYELGRVREALDLTGEAVRTSREATGAPPIPAGLSECTVAGYPTAFVARALWGFARVRAAEQVELPEALQAARESVSRYEQLTRQAPEAFDEGLAGSLRVLGQVHEALGQPDEAAAARDRAERIMPVY